jgi:hypothetical protein
MALSRTLSSTASRLGREARFVFTGEVETEAASSLSAVSAGPATAVVRVERVHRGTPVVYAQLRQPVTVIFPEGSAPGGSGSHSVFFTNPVLYGETLG